MLVIPTIFKVNLLPFAFNWIHADERLQFSTCIKEIYDCVNLISTIQLVQIVCLWVSEYDGVTANVTKFCKWCSWALDYCSTCILTCIICFRPGISLVCAVHLQSASVGLLCLGVCSRVLIVWLLNQTSVCMCPKLSSEDWFEVNPGGFGSHLAAVLGAILNTVRATQTGCGCSAHLQSWHCPRGSEGRTEMCLSARDFRKPRERGFVGVLR